MGAELGARRPELWAGVVGMAMLSGLGLSVLVLPPAVPAGGLGGQA